MDLICGGFPCQDLSVAGKRAGLGGERSGLFFEFMRIVKEMREATDGVSPTFVVLENVPGLFSSNGGRDFAVILAELAQLGALDVAWAVLDSQWFGVPQRRRRVFVVADFGGERATEILSLTEGLSGDTAPSRTTGAGTTPLLEVGARTAGDGYRDGDGIGHEGDPMYSLQAGHQHGVAHGITARYGKGPDSDVTDTVVAHTLRVEGFDASEDGTGRGTPIVVSQNGSDIQVSEDVGTIRPGMARQTSGPVISFNATQDPITDPDVMRALSDQGAAVGASVPRRLTPTECERLQGFPDEWTEGHAEGPRYRMMGNAVTVSVAEWIGRRLPQNGVI